MTSRKIFFILLTTLLITVFGSSLLPTQSALRQDGSQIVPKIEEYLNAAANQGFTGSALISRDGKVIFSKGYGLANRELDVLNTPPTKFRIGSITKQFTAAAILLLQERGKLSVQDPICKFFDNCPSAWNGVTIHHLLTHTGGVPSYTSSSDYRTKMMMPETVASMIDRFKDKPLEFKPGEKMSYSNSGYFLLGHIIEKASGESYEGFLQKNIFGPLKLSGTGYDHHITILKNRATGYSRGQDGMINSLYLDMSQPYAAGSLYSTVEDLFAWNEALFSDKLLSAKSREAMMTVDKNNYAYGLGVNQQHNRKMVSHGGGINGFNTFLGRFPDEKVTVVVLRNADFGRLGPGQIANAMAAILFGEKYEVPRERMAIKVNPAIYDAYIGQYELRPDFILTFTREGDRLMTQATGQPKSEVFPESETKFFLKDVDAQVTFVKDEKGVVTHLILHQGGDRKAMKIK
ncbi:MAG: serine hydrolase [Acidobacteria bacterium]|nr:serine hydrolase [Acidobacteriota bacterium]